MRIKTLLLAIAFIGISASLAAEEVEAVDSTMMGVHPFKNTINMAKPSTGFSLMFHGGVNVFNGDFPAARFMNLGYPSAGIAFEYNFSPVWGLGVGYNFDMPQVRATKSESFITLDGRAINKGDLMYKSMMHSGQIYVTFSMTNAWFPKAVSDIFNLNVYAGLGATLYKNSISFRDDENATGDSQKYHEDGPTDHAHARFESVGYIPVGATAEFNVSRQIALGFRAQYSMFLNDYVDNRYRTFTQNKSNDGMYTTEILLRWKINAKEKNHVMNVSSYEVLETKYYESHPEELHIYEHHIDTLVVYHKDTVVIIHRDTVVMTDKREQIVTVAPTAVVEPKAQAQPLAEGEVMTEERHQELKLQEDWAPKAEAQVVEGQSLSQLARRYYRNTFCWVYIWLANRSVAPDPNLILPSCQLQIPVLTDEQKSITKEEAKALAAKARAEKK